VVLFFTDAQIEIALTQRESVLAVIPDHVPPVVKELSINGLKKLYICFLTAHINI
jgi:hypothetical protein